MQTWVLCLAVAVGSLPGGPGTAARGVPVRLAPVSETAAVECDHGEVATALRGRIEKSRLLRWVDEAEDARVTLRLIECGQIRDSKVIVDEKHQPLKLPTEGRGVAFGGEFEYGARTETRTTMVLRVGASWEDGAEELLAREEGRSLDQAARVVVKELEDAVKDWGLADGRD